MAVLSGLGANRDVGEVEIHCIGVCRGRTVSGHQERDMRLHQLIGDFSSGQQWTLEVFSPKRSLDLQAVNSTDPCDGRESCEFAGEVLGLRSRRASCSRQFAIYGPPYTDFLWFVRTEHFIIRRRLRSAGGENEFQRRRLLSRQHAVFQGKSRGGLFSEAFYTWLWHRIGNHHRSCRENFRPVTFNKTFDRTSHLLYQHCKLPA